MRAADPVHNVELRATARGTTRSSSPSRTGRTSSTRCGRSPAAASTGRPRSGGRRAPTPWRRSSRACWSAIRRCSVAPDVARLALARGDRLDRPRHGGAARGRRRTSSSTRSPATCPRSSAAEERGGRLWLPFTQAGGRRAAGAPRGAAGPARAALRLAPAGRTSSPRPPSLALVEGYGEPRFRLDINWDPDTLPAFLALPACEAHGRTLPVDPYLLEPLEHYLRTYGVESAANAARGAGPPAPRARRRDRRRPPLARRRRPAAGGRGRPRRRAAAVPARRASPTCSTPGATFLADEQGLGKTVQALAALEADDAYPAVIVCPAGLKLNWRREIERWLPHRTLTVVSGTGTVAAAGRDHGPQLRDRPRPPRPAGAAAPEGAGARRVPLRQEPARQAHPGGAAAGRGAPARRAAAGADRHAGDEPRRRADRAAADPRPAARSSAPAPASPGASRARAPRSGSTGTCGAAASCAG